MLIIVRIEEYCVMYCDTCSPDDGENVGDGGKQEWQFWQ